MAVTVRIVPVPEPVKVTIKPKTPPPTITLELDIRKSLSGDLMIFDHGDIDIVLSGKDKKITAFPKQTMTEMFTFVEAFTFLEGFRSDFWIVFGQLSGRYFEEKSP